MKENAILSKVVEFQSDTMDGTPVISVMTQICVCVCVCVCVFKVVSATEKLFCEG